MSTDPFDFDDVSDEDHESQDCLTSLSSALTEHHHNTNYEGPFTLKTTTASSYVSHSDAEGLSVDVVGRLLASDRTPWSVDWIGLSFPVKDLAFHPPFPWIELHSNGAKWARIWVPATKKANLVGLRIHDLRKTAATNLVQAGIDIKSVTEILGHEDIRTTLQHYAKTTPEGLQAASETLVHAISIQWSVPKTEKASK